MKLNAMIILSFITYLCEGYVLWQYCAVLFERKYPICKSLNFYAVLYSIPVIFSIFNIPALNCVMFFITTTLIIKSVYNISWDKSLFHSVVASFTMLATESIVLLLVPDYGQNFYNYINNFQIDILIYLISKILYLIFMTLIGTYLSHNSKKNNHFSSTKVVISFFVSLITAFTLITMLEIYLYISLPFYINLMILFCSIALMMINVLIVILYNSIEKQNAQTTSLRLQIQRETLNADHYKSLTKQEENKNILLHDIRKHLQSIQLLNQTNSNEEIDKYISNIINSSTLSIPKNVCDNTFLNAIISRYINLCHEAEIDFKTDIRSNSTHFLTNDDCTALFCNILDNAYEAATNVSDGFIDLSVGYNNNHSMIVITLINSCSVSPFLKNGKLKRTTKSDYSHHGYGLKSVQNIVNKYHGDYKMYYDDTTATFHTVIVFQISTLVQFDF